MSPPSLTPPPPLLHPTTPYPCFRKPCNILGGPARPAARGLGGRPGRNARPQRQSRHQISTFTSEIADWWDLVTFRLGGVPLVVHPCPRQGRFTALTEGGGARTVYTPVARLAGDTPPDHPGGRPAPRLTGLPSQSCGDSLADSARPQTPPHLPRSWRRAVVSTYVERRCFNIN